jgi:hypothetical protein
MTKLNFMRAVSICLLLISLVAIYIGLHNSEKCSTRSLCMADRFRAAIDKSIFSVPFFSESIFVDNFTVYIDGGFKSSNDNILRNRLLQGYNTSVAYTGRYNSYGSLYMRRLLERRSKRVTAHCDAYPLADFIGRCLTKVLNFNTALRDCGYGEIQENFGNTHVGPQLSLSGIFHLGNNSFGLLSCLRHLTFLSFRDFRLSINRGQSETKNYRLQKSYENQPPCEISKFSLNFYIFFLFLFVGCFLWGVSLFYDHVYIRGGTLLLVGFFGIWSTLSTVCFGDPFFWRAEWRALSGTGNPYRCEDSGNNYSFHNAALHTEIGGAL